jgi:hypothetical protein
LRGDDVPLAAHEFADLWGGYRNRDYDLREGKFRIWLGLIGSPATYKTHTTAA